MDPGAVCRSPDNYLTAEKNPGLSQLGEISKIMCPILALNSPPCLKMRSIGSQSTS